MPEFTGIHFSDWESDGIQDAGKNMKKMLRKMT